MPQETRPVLLACRCRRFKGGKRKEKKEGTRKKGEVPRQAGALMSDQSLRKSFTKKGKKKREGGGGKLSMRSAGWTHLSCCRLALGKKGGEEKKREGEGHARAFPGQLPLLAGRTGNRKKGNILREGGPAKVLR